MKQTFYGGNVLLASSWSCRLRDKLNKKHIVIDQEYAFTDGTPTIGKGSTSISYSIPSGAKITKAVLYGSTNTPLSGISVLTLNSQTFTGVYYPNLSGNSGILNCSFTFKANGTKDKMEEQTSQLSVSGIMLEIEYEENAEDDNMESTSIDSEGGQTEIEATGFRVPPQNLCIYDQEDGKIYVFDGILKSQANMSLKIEEDPSKKKELYVNNARNEPTKVTWDVAMSDVYSGSSNLTIGNPASEAQQLAIGSFSGGGMETRSGRAAVTLRTLKEARHMLTVLTALDVFTDMLLQSVVINQDDQCPCGWNGQLTFQEKYEVVQKLDVTSSNATTSNVETRTPSWLYNALGVAVPSGG